MWCNVEIYGKNKQINEFTGVEFHAVVMINNNNNGIVVGFEPEKRIESQKRRNGNLNVPDEYFGK